MKKTFLITLILTFIASVCYGAAGDIVVSDIDTPNQSDYKVITAYWTGSGSDGNVTQADIDTPIEGYLELIGVKLGDTPWGDNATITLYDDYGIPIEMTAELDACDNATTAIQARPKVDTSSSTYAFEPRYVAGEMSFSIDKGDSTAGVASSDGYIYLHIRPAAKIERAKR